MSALPTPLAGAPCSSLPPPGMPSPGTPLYALVDAPLHAPVDVPPMDDPQMGDSQMGDSQMDAPLMDASPREPSPPAPDTQGYNPAALARMLEFGDSALPIGAFASSSALEAAVQKGVVHDADTLRAFTLTALEQAARGDAVGLAWAVRAARGRDWGRLERIDAAVHCRKLSEEARLMSTRMGKKLLELCVNIMGPEGLLPWLERVGAGQTPGMYPVSLGLAFARMDLSLEQALTTHQYGVAAAILNAALRLMRVTHLDTQRILFGLGADMGRQCALAAGTELEHMSGYAPMTDILGAVHGGARVRLFLC